MKLFLLDHRIEWNIEGFTDGIKFRHNCLTCSLFQLRNMNTYHMSDNIIIKKMYLFLDPKMC